MMTQSDLEIGRESWVYSPNQHCSSNSDLIITKDILSVGTVSTQMGDVAEQPRNSISRHPIYCDERWVE